MSFHEQNQDQIIEYRKKLKTTTKFINTYQMMKDFQRKQKRLKLN